MDDGNVAGALRAWLAGQSDAGLEWLDAAAEAARGATERSLTLAFAAAPRHVGRTLLPEGGALLGVPLAGWSRDQAARTLLLLARAQDETFEPMLERLFIHADLAEQVCLYQALSLLPSPARFALRAAEGTRSNMLPVFGAVALGNPYPADWFAEGAWNQMIVKTIFTGRPLSAVIGLDRRANQALADMLVDYARERRAAGREIAPDLWRPAGRFVDGERGLHELRLTLDGPDEARRRAAALALQASERGRAALGSARADLAREIEAGGLTWSTYMAA